MKSRAPTSTRPAGALFRIQAVARATGLSAHTLRVWERRFGPLSSARTEAGYRLFTPADIERLRQLKTLREAGHAISDLVSLSAPERTRLLATLASTEAPGAGAPMVAAVQERFLAAVERHDFAEAQRVADAAIAGFQLEELLTGFAAPVLVEIGERWKKGAFSVAQEHGASAVLRSALGSLLRAPGTGGKARVVATTPAGELHEFGALFAAVVACAAGAQVSYLGPSTPAGEVAHAAEATGASAVMVSVVAMSPVRAQGALGELRKALPRRVQLWAGGRGVSKAPAGVQVLSSFAALRAAIAQAG